MHTVKSLLCAVVVLLGLVSCDSDPDVPLLANPHTGEDSAAIPAFSFINQDGLPVTEKTFSGKLYVADFIFLSCATICPRMNTEMMRVYKTYENDNRVMFLSHTIDPDRDSIGALKQLANQLGVSSKKWHFVRGSIDSIYKIAEEHYFTEVSADSQDSLNFLHGGALLLIDNNRHIRGVYDGTNPTETDRLINDISKLIKIQYPN